MDHQAIYRLFSPWGILMRPWPSGQAKWLQGGNEALNKCAPDGSGARVIRRSTWQGHGFNPWMSGGQWDHLGNDWKLERGSVSRSPLQLEWTVRYL